MIAVSACLTGRKCRYDGEAQRNEKIARLVECGEALPFCPEVEGGMAIPRTPSEIKGTAAGVLCGEARVVSRSGEDVSAHFVLGAEKMLEFCRKNGVTEVILKAHSPSCGFNEVYDGEFCGKLIKGNGVTAELLSQNGIKIKSL